MHVFLAVLRILFIINLKAVFKCFSYRKLENGKKNCQEIILNEIFCLQILYCPSQNQFYLVIFTNDIFKERNGRVITS